ncbi:MAG: hypothetical protein KJ574_04030, partial [Nanoarchaeota archaeon]|nr:hypothetical protein [Nanoarchaeota archaeon]
MGGELIYCDSTSRFFDYCWYQYPPIKPTENKLKSINLLLDSIRDCPSRQSFLGLVKQLQKCLGADRTVFGIKKIGTRLAWEFYFYNYQKKDPEITITNILNIAEG